MNSTIKKYKFILFGILLSILVAVSCCVACSSSSSSNISSKSSSSSKSSTYKDSRWPTIDSELLSISEDKRWYTAKNRVGQYGYIAGPVKRVNQATESKGKPIYIDIGEAYPSSERAQIVIWDKDSSTFTKELNSCKKSGTWIMVYGKISSYKGIPELNSNDAGKLDFTIWEEN